MGSSRIITIATCQSTDATNARLGTLPSIHSTRSCSFWAALASCAGRGPRKKSRTLETNSCQGDSQSTPRSRRGRRECTGNASGDSRDVGRSLGGITRARWVPWEPEGMCVALCPMEYDAVRAEAAVLCDLKPGVQKAAERRCVTLKSLCAVVAPGRKGLMFCFLLLLLFDQNRVEMRFLDPGWLILVSVRWGLIVCFLQLLSAGQFRLEMRSR